MMDARVAIAPVKGYFVFIDVQSSFSEPLIDLAFPYVGKLFFVNIAERSIAPAAGIYRAVNFYPY